MAGALYAERQQTFCTGDVRGAGHRLVHVEILKGIAILMILLFHLDKYVAGGGFMGVDVFFAVSGYFLLKGYLAGDHAKDGIGAFFKKRIARLLPPLLLMLAIVLPVICALCYYGDILKVGETGFCTLLGVSNHYLDLCSNGYFAQDAFKNPLVHLWYLSTLVQCYIIFVIVIHGTQRWLQHKTGRLLLLVTIAIASFLLQQFPEWTGGVFGYYAASTRLWVFIAGGLAAKLPALRRPWMVEAGMVACAAALALVTLRPVPSSLPAVAAAVLVIRYAGDSSLFSLPGTGMLGSVGSMSYSLYLWHMPLIVLAKYLFEKQPYAWDRLMLIPVSLLLGYLSFRLVEQRKLRPVVMSAGYFAVLVLYGSAVYTGGFHKQLHTSVYDVGKEASKNLPPSLYTGDGLLSDYPCKALHTNAVVDFGNPTLWELFTARARWGQASDEDILSLGADGTAPHFVLLGDSHAAALAPGLDQAAHEQGWRGIYPKAYIVPFWSEAYDKEADKSPYATKLAGSAALMTWLGNHPELQTVIIVQRWSVRKEYYETVFYPGNPGADSIMEADLREYLTRLKQAGKRVLILTEVPRFPQYDLPGIYKRLILGRSIPAGVSQRTPDEYRQAQACDYFEGLFRQLEKEGLCDKVLHAERALMQGNSYNAIEGGRLLMHDDDHVNNLGARKVAGFLVPELLPYMPPPSVQAPRAGEGHGHVHH